MRTSITVCFNKDRVFNLDICLDNISTYLCLIFAFVPIKNYASPKASSYIQHRSVNALIIIYKNTKKGYFG